MITTILIITLVILIIGSITDLRTREVPDWVSFSAIAIGLGVRAIYSALEWNHTYILDGIIGFIVFFALACAIYYLGQWGGGDSKMLMALGALMGLQIDPSHFMVSFMINALFVGGVYGLLWCILLALTHFKGVHKELEKYHKIKTVLILKIITYTVSLIVIGLAFFAKDIKWVLIILAATIMALYHLWLLIKAVEAKAMIKRRAVSKLTEGDWVVHEIKHRGKYICGPKDLGLTKAKIDLLKKYKIRSITIKEGIPFIPSFLITFILTYFIGNILVYFL